MLFQLFELVQRFIIMEKDDGITYFCYMTIRNLTEFIIQIVLLSLSLLLVGDAFRKFYKMRGSHNKHVTFVYRLLLFWWLTYIASNSYGLVLYQLSDRQRANYINDDTLSPLTQYYFLIDWINAFAIQWLLLYLPYQWAKQISLLFDSLTAQKESEVEMETPATAYQGYQTTIYKGLKFYMAFRLTYLCLPIVFLIIDQSIVYKIMIISLLVDCIVITLSLIFGLISLKTTQQLKEQLDEQQSKRTFNQYLMLILANTIRFTFDLKHVITRVFKDDIQTNKCPAESQQDDAMSIALLICTCLLTFYLPVLIILRIYHLQEKPEQMCESLIISKVEQHQGQSSFHD